MSDQDQRHKPPDKDRPPSPGSNPPTPRARFQQPGGKPPAGNASGARGDRSAERAVAPEFPPTVMLYADHPLILIDRLQSLYDQAGLESPLPKSWALGMTLDLADADSWDQVQAALRARLPALLPIAVRVTEVEATVRDRQIYAAAWAIDPGSLHAIEQVRTAIYAALQPIVPAIEQHPLDVTIQVADSVPALAFPSLIAAMQQEFSPFAWSIDSIRLLPSDSSDGA